MRDRNELVDEFMEVFQMFAIKVQETDQSCVDIVAANDISKYDLALIGMIGKKGEVIMREVADYLDVPYSTATGVVDKLVSKKILKRINSETDRRTVKVTITNKKGQEIFDKFNYFRHTLGQLVLSSLDEKDFADMDRIMKKMAGKISDRNIEVELKKALA